MLGAARVGRRNSHRASANKRLMDGLTSDIAVSKGMLGTIPSAKADSHVGGSCHGDMSELDVLESRA